MQNGINQITERYKGEENHLEKYSTTKKNFFIKQLLCARHYFISGDSKINEANSLSSRKKHMGQVLKVGLEKPGWILVGKMGSGKRVKENLLAEACLFAWLALVPLSGIAACEVFLSLTTS